MVSDEGAEQCTSTMSRCHDPEYYTSCTLTFTSMFQRIDGVKIWILFTLAYAPVISYLEANSLIKACIQTPMMQETEENSHSQNKKRN